MSEPDYGKIARNAEADLNSHQLKTGSRDPDNAVDRTVERRFETAEVTEGDDLSTNAGYNKRIPPGEGGAHDDRGRQATGNQYEGEGGPLDKAAQRDGGLNDNDVVPARVPKVSGLGGSNDIATQGQAASVNNVGRNPPGPGGSAYKGEDYYQPESVQDSISAEGWTAPESVTQASRETEGY